ncbi:MAG TPA: acetyl-CoA hydrolase/transferase C-terminal domain-containing protein [Ignavibacteria bacterium]|nr:acetyl-CoA hydrolase/transferase C-terminal domain-containing protein [Ignavibacteria bacterium]HRA99888.1 acetyl-CoA hydrolase/transferase C-terminal domain-containing protein [Ignavibacteria bacterium]
MLKSIKSKTQFVSADDAVKCIKSGDNVYVHANCSFPLTLINSLCSRYEELKNVNIIQLMSFLDAPYVRPEMEGHFNLISLFTGANVRKAVHEGRADFIPVFLSEIPILLKNKKLPVDVCLLHLSPPDTHGFCSLGVSNECTKTAAENSRIIIAQINPKMPRVLGDNFIHIDKIDFAVEVNDEIPEFINQKIAQGEELKAYEKIGQNIASLIDNGSTLQMGIGIIPDMVLQFLNDKKDLGVHTEMFSDNLINLIESGVINGERKTLLPGKVVSTFILGSKKVFDYIDDNPVFEFRPTIFVNDPFVIARNDKMISINSALEVDLTGQVCADSIGHKNYSGFGGQLDFIRGASRSEGGIPIIAFTSTAKGGTLSRISPFLKQGAGVTTTRADVHYIITEYGIADIYGKTVRERARSLIEIAHPDFREELEKYAYEVNFLRKNI